MNNKYPTSLFIVGFITNLLFHFFWLLVPSIILLVVGIFVKPCLYVGVIVLAIDILLSLIRQIRIRNTFLEESDNPDFGAFQDALSNDKSWKENVKDFVNQKISDNQTEDDENNS